MVAEGKTTPEIFERLAALAHVLLDWSEQKIEMPNGKTPWEWDQANLGTLHFAKKDRMVPRRPFQVVKGVSSIIK
jgi:hypothetical protein